MIRWPHIQQQAQQDLKSVVGFERLPVVEDLAALPYIEAIVLETLRWIPVVPLGLPHRVMVDDEYSGYFIPRGTIIIPVGFLHPLSLLSILMPRLTERVVSLILTRSDRH